MRNFGLQNVRDDLRGVEHRPARLRANTTPRDSNSSDDRELGALIFAALFASPLIVLSSCLFYYAYFMI